MNRRAVIANVFSHLHTESTRVQRHEAFAEVTNCQRGAKEKISRQRGHQHQPVHHDKTSEIHPTKPSRVEPLFRNKRHAEFEAFLNLTENRDRAEHLKNRNGPNHDLYTAGRIDPEW